MKCWVEEGQKTKKWSMRAIIIMNGCNSELKWMFYFISSTCRHSWSARVNDLLLPMKTREFHFSQWRSRECVSVYSDHMLHLLWNTILFKGNQSQDAGWPQHKTWTLLKGIQNEDAAWPENWNIFLQKWPPSDGHFGKNYFCFICWWFYQCLHDERSLFVVVLFQIWGPQFAVMLVCSSVLYQSRAEKG